MTRKAIWISLFIAFHTTAVGQTAPGTGLVFSLPGGFYDAPILLDMHADGGKIYYTTDGSEPGISSPVFSKPLQIARTQVVRARLIQGNQSGPVHTHTFFINEPEPAIPVVSLSIAPGVLFDPVKGLFMPGPGARLGHYRQTGANFWSNAEMAAGVEIFDPHAGCVYNSVTGMHLFGEVSRLFPQKSLAFVSRAEYGAKRLDFPIFGDEGPKKFKYWVLRNGGSDFMGAHFRDAVITRAVRTWNVDVQEARPARVYINGQYWGMYNIREKINRTFLATHHRVHPDSLDILEHKFTVKKGSRSHYQHLLDYLERHSLADSAHYHWVCSQMDVSSFMDHQIAQIYFDNRDAGGNIRFWRTRSPGSRWRWIVFDTDWGMGLHDPKAFAFNSLQFHTAPDGPAWPNPPWSTFLLRKLLENASFREAFLLRFADRMNTTLRPEAILAHIETFYQDYEPEMDRHTQRWKLNRTRWESEVETLRTFARQRPDYMWAFLQEKFGTGSPLSLDIAQTEGGSVRLNTHLTLATAFQGRYFPGSSIRVEAVPEYGYRFSHWEGIEEGASKTTLSIRLDKRPLRLKAIFEPYQHPLCGKLVINEISAGDSLAGDWLELYNLTRKPVSLKGFQLRDLKGHLYVLPDVDIGPKDYLVLSQRPERFRKIFPASYNVAGPLPFGIHKAEEGLFLYDDRGAFIDSVQYRLPLSDIAQVLSLNVPQLDNGDLQNWSILPGHGTPNAPNPYFLESRIHKEQVLVMQLGFGASVLLLALILAYFQKNRR